ncbi:hypothetical protein AAG906_029529 [Vitis piasezkii]
MKTKLPTLLGHAIMHADFNAFIDTKKVTKSHIPDANTPARIDIRLKCGRPVGSKDVTPRKRRTQKKLGTLEEAIKMTNQFKFDKSIALEDAQIMQKAPKEAHIEQEAHEKPHIEREAPEEAQVPKIVRSHLAVSEGLDMHLMDVITTYLYGSIDNDIYMKIPEGFKLPGANSTKPRSMHSIKLQRSLYRL